MRRRIHPLQAVTIDEMSFDQICLALEIVPT